MNIRDFDPGPGYHMEQFDGEVPTGAVAFREEDGSWSYWVRDKPELPEEPYTVIRVLWLGGGQSVLVRRAYKDEWTWVETRHHASTSEVQAQGVEAFFVLSEPGIGQTNG